jgi:hypothetical protein
MSSRVALAGGRVWMYCWQQKGIRTLALAVSAAYVPALYAAFDTQR